MIPFTSYSKINDRKGEIKHNSTPLYSFKKFVRLVPKPLVSGYQTFLSLSSSKTYLINITCPPGPHEVEVHSVAITIY